MVLSKKFVTDMIEYMRDNRHMTIEEKCKTLGISVPGYYKACKRYGLNGKMNTKERSRVDVQAAQKVMDYARQIKMETQLKKINEYEQEKVFGKEVTDQHDSDTLICIPTQDSLE